MRRVQLFRAQSAANREETNTPQSTLNQAMGRHVMQLYSLYAKQKEHAIQKTAKLKSSMISDPNSRTRLEVVDEENNNCVLIRNLHICAPVPIKAYVKYRSDEYNHLRTQTSLFFESSLQIQLTRLRQCTTYHYRVFATDQDGATYESNEQKFTTGAVPIALNHIKLIKVGNPSPDLLIAAVVGASAAAVVGLPVAPVGPSNSGGGNTSNDYPSNSSLGANFIVGQNIRGQHVTSSLIGFDNDGEIVWYYLIGAPLAVSAVHKLPPLVYSDGTRFDPGLFALSIGFGESPADLEVRIITVDGETLDTTPTINTIDTTKIGTPSQTPSRDPNDQKNNIGSIGDTHDMLIPAQDPWQVPLTPAPSAVPPVYIPIPSGLPTNAGVSPGTNPELYYIGSKIQDPYYTGQQNPNYPALGFPPLGVPPGAALQTVNTIRRWFPGQYDIEGWSASSLLNALTNRGVTSADGCDAVDPRIPKFYHPMADGLLNSLIQSLNVDQLPIWPQEWLHSNAIRRSENPNDLYAGFPTLFPPNPYGAKLIQSSPVPLYLSDPGYGVYSVNMRQINQLIAIQKLNTNEFVFASGDPAYVPPGATPGTQSTPATGNPFAITGNLRAASWVLGTGSAATSPTPTDPYVNTTAVSEIDQSQFIIPIPAAQLVKIANPDDQFFAAHDAHILSPALSHSKLPSIAAARQVLFFDNGNDRPLWQATTTNAHKQISFAPYNVSGGPNRVATPVGQYNYIDTVPSRCGGSPIQVYAFSRALELEFDLSNPDTDGHPNAKMVWQYVPFLDPDSNIQNELATLRAATGNGGGVSVMYCPTQGSVTRLSNKNTLISFCAISGNNLAASAPAPFYYVIEASDAMVRGTISPDGAANTATAVGYYRVELLPGFSQFSFYRCLPYDSIMGETLIN